MRGLGDALRMRACDRRRLGHAANAVKGTLYDRHSPRPVDAHRRFPPEHRSLKPDGSHRRGQREDANADDGVKSYWCEVHAYLVPAQPLRPRRAAVGIEGVYRRNVHRTVRGHDAHHAAAQEQGNEVEEQPRTHQGLDQRATSETIRLRKKARARGGD